MPVIEQIIAPSIEKKRSIKKSMKENTQLNKAMKDQNKENI